MGRFHIGVVACACMLLAACGGTTKQSSIRHATAIRLASASDAVAVALHRGDSCGAATQAQLLRRQVAGAIASGAIPSSLAAPARTTSSRLASSIACTPAAPPPAPAPATCAQIDARKKALEQDKHADDNHKRHAPDQQRKGCK